MDNTFARKAYSAMYRFLDYIYSQNPYTNLACILGDINPTVFSDSESADPAVWEDFVKMLNDAQNAYSSECDAAYFSCVQFLNAYQNEYSYPIPYAMEAFTREKYWEYYYNQEKIKKPLQNL